MKVSTIHWPAEEWKRAKSLLDRGFSVPMVSQMIGRSQEKLRGKIRWEVMTIEKRQARAEQIKATRQSRAKAPETQLKMEKRTFEKAPAELFTERQKRQRLEHRDLTGAFCGDPLPGYSALDRKLNGETQPSYIDARLAQLQRRPSLPQGPPA